jgi:hypothetical protein
MFWNRVIGVFRLNPMVFEEIELDENATSQAALVVLVVALVSGAGGLLSAALTGNASILSFLSALAWAFLGWLVWSGVSYFVGTSLFGGKATFSEMLRVIGFAYAPQVLAIIPCVGFLIGLVWSLMAGFIAVRQGLDVDDVRAFLTVLIGMAIYAIGYVVISILLGLTSALF